METDAQYAADPPADRKTYNGIEHFPVAEMGLAHYRTLDAGIGRWLQVDPEAESFYPLSPYNSMGNNPVSMVDPDGDFFTGIEVVANVVGTFVNAAFGGYDNFDQFLTDLVLNTINGLVSEMNPADFNLGNFGSVGVSPKFRGGTDGIMFGVEGGARLGIGNHKVIEAYAGVNIYSNNYGTNTTGGNFYAGVGVGYGNEKWGAFVRSTYFGDFAGETSQRIGGLYTNIGNFKLSYENDGHPWHLIGLGDGGDSYRSSSASLGWGDFSLNLNIFTGYRDYDNNLEEDGYPYQVVGNPEADKYREGILSIGYKNLRVGWNSEGIRHTFQNRFAHRALKPQPWFRKLSGLNRLMIGTDYGSEFHNW